MCNINNLSYKKDRFRHSTTETVLPIRKMNDKPRKKSALYQPSPAFSSHSVQIKTVKSAQQHNHSAALLFNQMPGNRLRLRRTIVNQIHQRLSRQPSQMSGVVCVRGNVDRSHVAVIAVVEADH